MHLSGSVYIQKNCTIKPCEISLPSSKSESNRALIINALSGNNSVLNNLSEARDTKTLQKLLAQADLELNVLDAGTTMRFLIAYFSVTNQEKILTGTPRMCERPVKILADALTELGAKIEYVQKEGYPPLHLKGLQKQIRKRIKVRGDISSQYISALLMIAPVLEQGLELELTGKVNSKPYIMMTLELMKSFGITYDWQENFITILPQQYAPTEYSIESDWSGASYWYSFLSLADSGQVVLKGLKKNSLQGDIQIAKIMANLGVKTEFVKDGVALTKTGSNGAFSYNFADCPDLAQTVAVACAAKGISCEMTGLESLRIKETDRIAALQNELAKIGAQLIEQKNIWKLVPSSNTEIKGEIKFDTYDDHRMAMALAPLSTKANIVMENPDVVNKSYPGYWNDLSQAGFMLNYD